MSPCCLVAGSADRMHELLAAGCAPAGSVSRRALRCNSPPYFSAEAGTTRQRKPGLRFLPQQEGGI